MDTTDEDFNDASWEQAQQEERAMVEQRMLTDDPGYRRFLQSYQEHS